MSDYRATPEGRREAGARWNEEGGWPAAISSSLDIRRLITTFRRRLRLFLAIAILILIAVVVFTVRATPLYSATANVMIDTRTERVVASQAVLSGLTAESSVVDTEVEILRSRRLAERVTESLDLYNDAEFNGALAEPGAVATVLGGVRSFFGAAAPDAARADLTAAEEAAQREMVVDGVMSRLGIQRAGLTYVMNITFTSEDPQKAALIANTFADHYLLEQLEAKFDATRQANSWLSTRLADLRGEVQQAEAAVAQYKAANNLLSSEGATQAEQDISAINQQLATARAEQAEEEARLRTARAQLAAGSSGDDVGEALGSQVVQRLRERRAEVSGRVADLGSRYGPRHPDLLRAQQELRDIDEQIQSEIQRIISNLEARVQVSRGRTGSLAGSLGQARGVLGGNTAASVRLNELERNATSLETEYQQLLARFQQTSASEGIEQSDARIVSRAKVPTSPSSPNLPLNLVLGFMLAVGGGLAGVVLAEMLDSGLGTSEDVERSLNVAHLGSIPLMGSVADAPDRNMPPVDHVLKRPLSAFAEAFRSLRASVLYSRIGKDTKVVAVTSALPGEGKTTTSLCLARVAAQAGGRVVMVDCDLRRRNVNRQLKFEPELGLLDVLNGEATLEQAMIVDEPSGAYVLPLTKNSFTPKDVFGSEAMDDLLERLRASFDLVILDTAPVLAVADTRVLAAKADTTLLLARWRKTPDKAVLSALHYLTQSGAHVSGVALTQMDMNAQVRYGYGDASYYYSEYKKYYTA